MVTELALLRLERGSGPAFEAAFARVFRFSLGLTVICGTASYRRSTTQTFI